MKTKQLSLALLVGPLVGCGDDGLAAPDQESPELPVVWASLSAGETGGFFGNTCGLTRDGVAYCWGDNTLLQLGRDTLVIQDDVQVGINRPVRVSGGLTFSMLSLG